MYLSSTAPAFCVYAPEVGLDFALGTSKVYFAPPSTIPVLTWHKINEAFTPF